MSPFRRNPAKTKFGKNVLAIHQEWQGVIRGYPDPDALGEPNFLCLMAATAGATVALGSYGTYLREFLRNDPAKLAAEGVDDPTGYLAHAFETYAGTEAAWRVATWAVVSELADFYWRPNYLLELNECAIVFGFENEHERRVIAYGAPRGDRNDIDAQIDRTVRLARGSLISMIAAATQIDATDSPWIDIALEAWADQFLEARSVAFDYLRQVVPEGLPIWDE